MQFWARAAIVVAASAVFLSSGKLSAEAQAVLKPLDRPDSASITVPNVIPTSSGDYFYFHKMGVSYEKAFSDLDECRIFSLQARLTVLAPRFVPLGSASVKSNGITVSPQFLWTYGFVGVLVAAPFIESAEDDNADTTNRRCMMYKGYSRYGTTRAIWKKITVGTDAEKLARMALIASGPEPKAGVIGP